MELVRAAEVAAISARRHIGKGNKNVAVELVSSNNALFVATGVTDGALVQGVSVKGPIIRTDSIILRGHSGTIRRIQSDYNSERWA